jgi:hypothetical protein
VTDQPQQPMTVELEVRTVTDPAGQTGVLLQFAGGWLVTSSPNARRIAALILDVANEADQRIATSVLADEAEEQTWSGR